VKAHRVQAWLGEHLIIEHDDGTERAAAEYEQAMRRRWPSLRVTNDLVDAAETVPR
jgi:hypothetical protein